MHRPDVTIDRRFRGPQESANGGYVAGLLAAMLAPATAEVRLHLPPPLHTPLTPRVIAGGVSEGRIDLLTQQGTCIASAKPVPAVALDIPRAPTLAQASDAAQRFRGYPVQEFRGCFVCGPDRAAADGMRLFAGARTGLGVATPWTPDHSLVRAGAVAMEFVWAALDCPGYFACRDDGAPMVLGQMTATIHELPIAGTSYVISGWPISRSGRKFTAGTALHAADGGLLAVAHAIWIELKPLV